MISYTFQKKVEKIRQNLRRRMLIEILYGKKWSISATLFLSFGTAVWSKFLHGIVALVSGYDPDEKN